MDLLTFLLIVLFLAAVVFILYYYLRGAKGELSLARPVESRVDEYLDRRFQNLVDEWQLVNRKKLGSFSARELPHLEQDEARLRELKTSETDMQNTLHTLEARLDHIEKELVQKGTAKK